MLRHCSNLVGVPGAWLRTDEKPAECPGRGFELLKPRRSAWGKIDRKYEPGRVPGERRLVLMIPGFGPWAIDNVIIEPSEGPGAASLRMSPRHFARLPSVIIFSPVVGRRSSSMNGNESFPRLRTREYLRYVEGPVVGPGTVGLEFFPVSVPGKISLFDDDPARCSGTIWKIFLPQARCDCGRNLVPFWMRVI